MPSDPHAMHFLARPRDALAGTLDSVAGGARPGATRPRPGAAAVVCAARPLRPAAAPPAPPSAPAGYATKPETTPGGLAFWTTSSAKPKLPRPATRVLNPNFHRAHPELAFFASLGQPARNVAPAHRRRVADARTLRARRHQTHIGGILAEGHRGLRAEPSIAPTPADAARRAVRFRPATAGG